MTTVDKGKACIVVLLFCSPMKLMTFSRRPNDKYCVVPEDGNSIFFLSSFVRFSSFCQYTFEFEKILRFHICPLKDDS